MPGIKKRKSIKRAMIAVAAAAAIFTVLYYTGLFLPQYTVWHTFDIEGTGEDEPELIELKGRRVRIFDGGRIIFKTPAFCRVSNMIFSDIDRDGEKELILLNYNIGEFGSRRPFWVKFDPPFYRQHIYIYDYRTDEKQIRPIWMASDIGVKARDFEQVDEDVIRITDRTGDETNWMWISFGLRCVD